MDYSYYSKHLYKGFFLREDGSTVIIYKGKRVQGDWITGSYVNYDLTTYCVKEDGPVPEAHKIIYSELMDWGLPNRIIEKDVLPETVGQFVKLDSNKKPIFEGDWVRILYTDWMSKPESDPRTLDQYLLEEYSRIGKVVWDPVNLTYRLKLKKQKTGGRLIMEDGLYSIEPGKYGYIKLLEDICYEIS